MYVSRIVSEVFSFIRNDETLKSTSEVTEGHWKWSRLIDHVRLYINLSL